MGRSPRVEFFVPVGSHALQARMGALMSQPAYFRAIERETVSFACVAAGLWQKRLTLHPMARRQPEDRFGRGRSAGAAPSGPHEVSPDWRGDSADWHVVLNVADTSGAEEIRRAYLDLIRRFHPDRLARLDARERQAAENAARIVNNAYAAARNKHRLS